jgi:hypothetical protein
MSPEKKSSYNQSIGQQASQAAQAAQMEQTSVYETRSGVQMAHDQTVTPPPGVIVTGDLVKLLTDILSQVKDQAFKPEELDPKAKQAIENYKLLHEALHYSDAHKAAPPASSSENTQELKYES